MGIVQAEVAASQQDGPEDAGNGDSLPSSLQWMNGNDVQSRDQAEEAMAAPATSHKTAVNPLGDSTRVSTAALFLPQPRGFLLFFFWCSFTSTSVRRGA